MSFFYILNSDVIGAPSPINSDLLNDKTNSITTTDDLEGHYSFIFELETDINMLISDFVYTRKPDDHSGSNEGEFILGHRSKC